MRGRCVQAVPDVEDVILIKKLTPDLWQQRLQFILERIELSESKSSIELGLRHMFHLSQLAPGPFGDFSRPTVDESAFEQLLYAGDLDAAALALIGDAARFFGQYDAISKLYTVKTEFCELSIVSESTGLSLASAIISSWVKSFLAIYRKYGEIVNLNRPGYQFGSLPPPNEH